MDRCEYCKEYHAPYTVCDGYIEAVKRGEIEANNKWTMKNTRKSKQKSGQHISELLEMFIRPNGKTLRTPFCASGIITQKQQIKLLNSLLLIAYGNVQVAKGILAISKESYSFLLQQQRAEMILELMWENEKILGTLKDYFLEQTEQFYS